MFGKSKQAHPSANDPRHQADLEIGQSIVRESDRRAAERVEAARGSRLTVAPCDGFPPVSRSPRSAISRSSSPHLRSACSLMSANCTSASRLFANTEPHRNAAMARCRLWCRPSASALPTRRRCAVSCSRSPASSPSSLQSSAGHSSSSWPPKPVCALVPGNSSAFSTIGVSSHD